MGSLKIKQDRREELVFFCFLPLDLIYSSVGRTGQPRRVILGSKTGQPGSVILGRGQQLYSDFAGFVLI